MKTGKQLNDDIITNIGTLHNRILNDNMAIMSIETTKIVDSYIWSIVYGKIRLSIYHKFYWRINMILYNKNLYKL